MAAKISVQTTFSPVKVIQPIFTGGDAALSSDGRLLATSVDDGVLVTEVKSGEQLARIEGVSFLLCALFISYGSLLTNILGWGINYFAFQLVE
jgi:U3 small nucleolar RNA-associated protein 13